MLVDVLKDASVLVEKFFGRATVLMHQNVQVFEHNYHTNYVHTIVLEIFNIKTVLIEILCYKKLMHKLLNQMRTGHRLACT